MPAPFDPATLLVEVLVRDIGLKAGEAAPDQRLKERYVARGHSPDEIASALKQAHAADWIRWDAVGGGTFFLTEAGFEAADSWPYDESGGGMANCKYCGKPAEIFHSAHKR
jgi:hypothetical protein